MRALIQRVSNASVIIDDKTVGKIKRGLVILLGITHEDTEADIKYLTDKCVNLRVFCDDNDKMNRSLLDVEGEALIISQFTLYGDTRKGRRPGFSEAARPDHATVLYEKFVQAVKNYKIKVATGKFGAKMLVDIKNDGPVTLMLESK